MNKLFENLEANERANSLMDEITEILYILENVDNLMPSSSLEQKLSVDPTTKEKFRELSENSLQFLDDRISRYKDEMNSISEIVGEANLNYRSIADGIVILSCKILQFQIGKVLWFVNQNKFWSDKELYNENYQLLYNIKRILFLLGEFDTSDIGSIELIETDRKVINISKRLIPNSIFQKLLRMFK
ncbi:MAG: hypothetical protein CFE25_06175 [Chitinophagaceae bacterium BSSC1]|nr:MAG: hypothetical protein CFE25_06175 [Chitinophagaceae bacterium BSSC1]